LCATSMPVRILGHSSWSAQLHLQEGSEQNVQTSRTQRPGGSRLGVSGNTCGQRTSGSLPGRRQTGKRPDGLMMVPCREGKPLTWDVAVVCPLAELYIGDSATNAGSAEEAAATRKAAKYTGLERTHIFQPVAVEYLGTMNASAYGFLAYDTRCYFNVRSKADMSA